MVDARTPVIVGVSQLSARVDDPASALEPVALMAEVAQTAIDDAAGNGLGSAVELVIAVKGAWSYRDPARVVADRLGARSARTALTTDGGNTPQVMVDVVAERIARGEVDVAVIVGAEAIWSRRRVRATGHEREVLKQADDVEPDERLGRELALTDDHERSRGIAAPVELYPIFESAIRHRRGESHDAHRRRIATMWADFNAVAVDNPHAWSRKPMTADDIREPGPGNRMVAFPYTKAMCSNWDLDQAAALVLCSAEAADRYGVARDRWVFVHAGTEADDTDLVSCRGELGRSPAIAAAWAALQDHTRLDIDDFALLDVYSCFPSAVQAAAEAIGLDESRRMTVTGGLTFAGGPLNNYVTHSIASMVERLREHPEARGLVTANGGFLTKHALGVYSATPPDKAFARTCVTSAVAHQARAAASDATGDVEIEAYTVMHDHDGPTHAYFALLTPDGRRTWGKSTDDATMKGAMSEELVGRRAHLDGDGTVSVA